MSKQSKLEPEGVEKVKSFEPVHYGDPTKGGIVEALEGLDDIFAGQDPKPRVEEPQKTVQAAPEKQVEQQQQQQQQQQQEPPERKETPIPEKKEEVKKEEVVPETVIDEPFFKKTEKKEDQKQDEKAFDESAYDTETATILKSLEEKGHPGEVYKGLRAELKTALQSKASPEILKEIETLKIKAAEAEGLRARLDKVSEQSARLQVENSPEYEEQILHPAARIFDKVDAIAKANGFDNVLLQAIVKETDDAKRQELIAEHLAKFSEYHRSEIYRFSHDYETLVDRRMAMLDKATEKLAGIEKERAMRAEQLLKEQHLAVQMIQKGLWNKYRDKIPGFVDENGKDTKEFTDLVAEGLSIDFSTAQASDQAFAAFAGVALGHVMKQVRILQRKLAEYEKGDRQEVRGKPEIGGTGTPTEQGVKPGKSFVELAAETEFTF